MRNSGADEQVKYQTHVNRWERMLERVRAERDESVSPPLASGLLKLDAERRPDTSNGAQPARGPPRARPGSECPAPTAAGHPAWCASTWSPAPYPSRPDARPCPEPRADVH
eukprot:4454695-Pyramimonas_sp.AAC.1